MIRIIKEGISYPSRTRIYKNICDNCGCEFEFDYKEILKMNTLSAQSVYMVCCPTCGNILSVNFENSYTKEDE